MDTKLIRRFKRVRITLMRSSLFAQLGPLMMLGKTELVDDTPTACTNGRDEKYGVEFIQKLNDRELGFVFCHENMHKAARHLTTYRALHKENPMLANAACDYWINIKLVKADPHETLIAMPRDKSGENIGLLDKAYDGMTVKAIYELLKQQGDGGGGFDEHDWDGANELSEEEQKRLEEDVKQAIRQGQMAAKKAGQGASGAELGLAELTVSKIDWRAQLKQFVRYSCRRKEQSSYRKPNRRFLYQDIVMPTIVGNSVRELVAASDTSGSMLYGGRKEKAMSEVKAICKTMGIDKLHIIYWDGAVEGHEIYSCDDLNNAISRTQMRGGGGTDPSCVPKYLEEHSIRPDAVVMLTDGEVFGGWGNWTCPVLWAIINGGHRIMAPVGQTIQVIED